MATLTSSSTERISKGIARQAIEIEPRCLKALTRKRETRELRQEVKAGFDRMQWSLLGVAGAIIAALIGIPHL